MSSQQFDNYIKEQFSQYLPEVDPRIWENIAARTERKKPVGFWYTLLRNRGRFMLIALFLLLGTGAGTWWVFKTTNPPGNRIPQVSEIAQPVSADKAGAASAASNTGTDLKTGKPVSSEQPTLVPGENNDVKETTGGTNDQIAGSTTSLRSGSRNTVSIVSPGLEDELNTKPNAVQKERNHSANGKKTRKTTGQLQLATTAPATEEDTEEEYILAGGTLLNRLHFEAEKVSAKRKSTLLTPVLKPSQIDPGCPTFEKDAAGNKKYLEVYAGPDYAFRSLSDTANSEYLRRRKESSQFSSAFSAGFRYTRVFSNSMSVRAGLNYSQINEKFKFKQGNIVQVVYIIGTNGDTIGSYTVTGTRYKTTINNYRSIDIPLAIGYELGNGRWHANINAGVVINLYSWQRGDILDASYNPVSITTGKSSSPYQFRTNAGVGFMGGVSVYYKLNDRFHLFAEPYFRYSFSPMNKDNITLKQKYQTAGLRLGVRLDLK